MREIKRAQELDPLSAPVGYNVAIVSLLNNDVNSAIEQSKRIIELDPSWAWAHQTLGWAYLKQRRDEEAVAEFQKALWLACAQSIAKLTACVAALRKRIPGADFHTGRNRFR